MVTDFVLAGLDINGEQELAITDARYACDQGVKKACDILQRF